MWRWSRLISLLVAPGLLAWLLSHAGGFNPDGSPVDPNPPPLYLVLGGIPLHALLLLHAAGFRAVPGGRHDDAATTGSSEDVPADAGGGGGR